MRARKDLEERVVEFEEHRYDDDYEEENENVYEKAIKARSFDILRGIERVQPKDHNGLFSK
jgi:hypothetical protein